MSGPAAGGGAAPAAGGAAAPVPTAYARFVATGTADWDAVEQRLAALSRKGPGALDHAALDGLAAAHRRVVADFAWARTSFPGTPAEARLRRLAFDGHQLLAAREAPLGERVRDFFLVTFPRAFAETAPERAVALAVMGGAMLLGLVLGTLDEGAANWFLGEEQVAGMRRGEMWTDHVTSVAPGGAVSGFIARNNMSVALVAWIGGAVGGLGSLYVLVFNGLMLGVIVAACVRFGTLARLLAFIPAHGILELYVISLASAAGLKLASGLVVASPHPRARTAPEAARTSLALAVGTLPWLFLLGAVEGFVSPLDLPLAVDVAIGVALLLLFLGATRLRGVLP